MKKIFLITCILFSVNSIYSQLPGVYKITDFDKGISCFLYFFESGCYNLTFSETKPRNTTYILSSGKFNTMDNIITLLDAANEYEIKLRFMDNKELKIIQGFPFLLFRTFSFYREYTVHTCIDFDVTPEDQQKERDEYQQKHPVLYRLKYGVYENIIQVLSPGITMKGYELKISEDHTYKLYFKRYLFSIGSWSREGNILTLYDTDLNHSFYVLITEEGLISKYLPADYTGDELKFREYKFIRSLELSGNISLLINNSTY